MEKFHKEVKEVEVVDQIICDCCGEFIKKQGNRFEEYIHINKTFGYLSNLYDGQIHNLDICEECYNKILSTFKFSPKPNKYEG